MNIITYIIIGAVIILMAIIGYIADKNKKPKQENKPTQPTSETLNQGAQTWSEKSKPKDERQETIHKVPTVDDWSTIPTNTDQLPEVQLENPNTQPETQNDDMEPIFPDIKPTDLEIPELKEPEIKTEPVENLAPETIPSIEQPPIEKAPIAPTSDTETTSVETLTTEPNPVTTPVELMPAQPVQAPIEALNTKQAPQVENITPVVEPVIQMPQIEPTPLEPQTQAPMQVPKTEPTTAAFATPIDIIPQTPAQPVEVQAKDTIPQPTIQTMKAEPLTESVPVQTPVINVPQPETVPPKAPETPTEPQSQNQTSIWN